MTDATCYACGWTGSRWHPFPTDGNVALCPECGTPVNTPARMTDAIRALAPRLRTIVAEWAPEWRPDGAPTCRTVPLDLAVEVCEAVQRLHVSPLDLGIDPAGVVFITRSVLGADNGDGTATVSVAWTFERASALEPA